MQAQKAHSSQFLSPDTKLLASFYEEKALEGYFSSISGTRVRQHVAARREAQKNGTVFKPNVQLSERTIYQRVILGADGGEKPLLTAGNVEQVGVSNIDKNILADGNDLVFQQIRFSIATIATSIAGGTEAERNLALKEYSSKRSADVPVGLYGSTLRLRQDSQILFEKRVEELLFSTLPEGNQGYVKMDLPRFLVASRSFEVSIETPVGTSISESPAMGESLVMVQWELPGIIMRPITRA